MSKDSTTKINQLVMHEPKGVVFTSSWLASKGYNLDLQKRYKNSNWLESIGYGALVRAGDQVGYEGAVYALQNQLGLSVHPAARSALSLLGKAHYLEIAPTKIYLFGQTKEILPSWFQKRDWGMKLEYHQSSFLPPDIGITDFELRTFSIKVSSAARALMECLYLAPEKLDLIECYELMEGLNNLRPNLVQKLLEQCTSVKVKRLFLYMAEKSNHDWFQYLDLNRVDMGKGKRSLVKNGIYIPKYQITVPKEIEGYVEQGL